MANPDGTPIWYELMTADADGAQAFYTDVAGWSIAPAPGGDPAMQGYRILTAPDGQAVGGLMTLPADAPMTPGWFAYLGVADVDGTANRIRELGGAVHMGPMDIPGVGRFAFVADPQGQSFYVMRGDGPGDSEAFHDTAIGHCGWNEIVSSDAEGALRFYGALFGWTSTESMPMGELGDYRFIDHAGQRIGALMAASGGFSPRWTCYFTVPSIDAAIARITAGRGSVAMGPHEVPGGMFIVMGTDPQGADFALVGGK